MKNNPIETYIILKSFRLLVAEYDIVLDEQHRADPEDRTLEEAFAKHTNSSAERTGPTFGVEATAQRTFEALSISGEYMTY